MTKNRNISFFILTTFLYLLSGCCHCRLWKRSSSSGRRPYCCSCRTLNVRIRNLHPVAKHARLGQPDSNPPCRWCTRSSRQWWSLSCRPATCKVCWCTWFVAAGPSRLSCFPPRSSSTRCRPSCPHPSRRPIPRHVMRPPLLPSSRHRRSSVYARLLLTRLAYSASLASAWRWLFRRSCHPGELWRGVTCVRQRCRRLV